MKLKKWLSTVIVAGSIIAASVPLIGAAKAPAVSFNVKIEINGVNVYSPANHALLGKTYVDAAAYMKLIGAKYQFDAKNKAVTVSKKKLAARIVLGVPTVPVQDLAKATGGDKVSVDSKTSTTYVLDLPAGTVQLTPSVPGMGEHWANPKDMPIGPIYGVEKGKLVFLEYMVKQSDFADGISHVNVAGMKGLPSPAIQHTDIEFQPNGHEGFEVPHYDIHHYFVSHAAHLKFGPPVQAKKSIVALGDSITFGYNLGSNNDRPSQYAFPFLIGGGQYNVKDLGVPRWDSEDLLKALETPEYQKAIKEADYITVDIGSNDLLAAANVLLEQVKKDPSYIPSADDQAKFKAAIEQFGSNLPAILTGIRIHTKAPIILYNLYNPFPSSSVIPVFNSLHNIGDQVIVPMNKIVEETANQPGLNIYLADAYKAFDGKQGSLVRVAQSDIHPTIEGQKVLAKLADEALVQIKKSETAAHKH